MSSEQSEGVIVRIRCTGECQRETRHTPVGQNMVGRPIWKCVECGVQRVGPLAANVDVVETATDGGSRD